VYVTPVTGNGLQPATEVKAAGQVKVMFLAEGCLPAAEKK
jgi:hypothetical protein